ncbi:MAG: GNAT family N-acetyltransferase [Bacteroidia bacterium]|nr:GNAT family N-acetyltransferase [Bacteroidia bacterium]
MKMSMIKKVESPEELLKVSEVMQALRPQLNEKNITVIVGGMMQRGYHLLYAEDQGRAVAAIGYRFTEHLHWGKAVYIDDLSTLPGFRKRGYARQLLDEVLRIARSAHCQEVHLDSGCGPNRYEAHRLYLGYGFNITSHHFAISLK